MTFIKDFTDRGYLYQSSNLEVLTEISNSGQIIAYIGFDCTAKSLHVGNLMQIMILRLLQQHGHKPIVLVGGATTKIGDPSGRDETRKLLTDDDIAENIAGIKKSLSKFIKFGEGENDAIIVNNSDWLESWKYIDFLRENGRHFSVNRMLTMDSVKLRLDRTQNLTFLEFNYMLFQAYDFYHLNKHYGCAVQIGGSDQWGNIIMGVDFTRKVSGNEVFALTTPLLTSSSGAKMGKSVSGAVWLNEDMYTPYDYFQYWRNIEDPDVLRFAKLYSEWDIKRLEEFVKLIEQDINAAKKELAFWLTALCHGMDAANEALETAKKVFEEGGIGDDLPVFEFSFQDFENGIPAFELFFNVGLASSKSEAKKLIRGGGARINNVVVVEEALLVDQSYFNDKVSKLSSGKKRHILVKLK